MKRSELKQLIRETIEEISATQVRAAAKVAADKGGYNDPIRGDRLNKMANLKDTRLVMQALERARVAYNKKYEDQKPPAPAPFPTPFKDAKIKYRVNTNRGEEMVGQVIAADKDSLTIRQDGYTSSRVLTLNSKKKLTFRDFEDGFIAFDKTSRFKLILIFRGLNNTEINQNNIIVYTY